MIESGFGRTDHPEVGKRRVKTRRPAEAQDGEVRQPWTFLALVHAELFQSPVEVAGKLRRALLLVVVEDEHADASRLAVAAQGQAGWPCSGGSVPQRSRDRPDLGDGPVPEERQRDVDVSGRDDPHVSDRKSTRLNSSHGSISYAVFCLKKKKT